MEPNDNIQNNNISEPRPVRAPGFANGDVAGGDTSGGVMPVSGGNDAVFQDKPKKSHGMLYGMILLAILAAGGIGFGVWAMLDGNSRAQKKDEQISQLQSQLAEKSEVVVDDDATVVDDNDVASEDLNATNFVYLGNWGIKVKIGGLRVIGMQVQHNNNDNTEVIRIAVSSQDQYRDASNYNSANSAYPQNYIVRSKQATIKPYAFMGIQEEYQPIYNDGEYNYFTFTPTGYALEGLADSNAAIEAYNAMTEILNDSTNYSKI